MKLVIFGLTVSSSWGNGHATIWRGLIRALTRRGHRVVFFERDVSYYAQNRDLFEIEGGRLCLYSDWADAARLARGELAGADVGIVTSYCPDGVAAGELLQEAAAPLRVFYDLDTPVTLARLEAGEDVGYVGPRGLRDYDLVLSYTGGAALRALEQRLGARRVTALYGSVDPEIHHRVAPIADDRADLSYLGTYAADRQAALERLFVAPARHRPERRFLIGGAQYPQDFPWTENIYFVRHVPPARHSAFYSSGALTLNVTRAAMAAMGWCPSGRLFEAAACGTPILSDWWEGLDSFLTPSEEILIGQETEDAVAALDLSPEALARIGGRARERTLAEHTAGCRADELERALDAAKGSAHDPGPGIAAPGLGA